MHRLNCGPYMTQARRLEFLISTVLDRAESFVKTRHASWITNVTRVLQPPLICCLIARLVNKLPQNVSISVS